MSIGSHIRVNTRYTRSTNVERDRNSQAIVEAYLPTSKGVSLLTQVSGALGATDLPRAWSLIGPYGSGKSSFALFLNELLGDSQSEIGKAALQVLGKEHASLAESFGGEEIWCSTMLTGSAEPLSKRLVSSLERSASDFWVGKKGRKPSVLQSLKMAKVSSPTTNEILELVDDLQRALEKVGSGGLLIVVDELGKFLEYEARHYGANDIFLLQGLAERAFRGGKTNLMLFVLLHQGFDLYARGLGESLKNDWAKVQGRFQTVPFIETTEQTLRIVAAAFDNALNTAENKQVRNRAKKIAEALDQSRSLPGILDESAATDLFTTCYPIHPVALLALPVLCQKFAQNERTLFSYLGSQEPHGFRYSVERLESEKDWIDPSEIYDYFIQNQPTILADPLTHRRWAEVVTAVERANELGAAPSELAKTIGLLNLIAGQDGIKASDSVVRTLFESKQQASKALTALLDASVVQYRRFNREYRVWQGTDFNIDQEVHLESEKLGRFELAATLSERLTAAPIVARRHSTEYGALRYFSVEYVDAQSYRRLAADHSTPRLVFFIAEGQDDETVFEVSLAEHSDNDIWILFRNGSDIRSAIREVLSLEAVQRGAQELSSDPVASKEIKERLNAARIAEESILNSLTTNPIKSDWYWKRTNLEISNRRALQHALSRVMDDTYSLSPKIHNELINRDKLSSQAAAARNKLFHLMLTQANQPGLGIEKYPPEKSIYRSIFERGELHVDLRGRYGWLEPDATDPLCIRPLWRKFDDFLASTETGPISIAELMTATSARPYGLKQGPFPLLFLHYYLLHKHEIAAYENGIYMPSLTYEHLERMVKGPGAFSFQRFRIEGVRANLFDEYAKALFGESKKVDVLSIAKPLATFMLELDEYTKKTRRLSSTTLKVREAFFLSKSPEKLLLQELPRACGFKTVSDVNGLSDQLLGSLRELKGAYAALLTDAHSALCASFNIPHDTPLHDLREVLRGRAHGLDRYTVDLKGLKSFVRRLGQQLGTDEEWITSLLHFIGHKSAAKWTDQDRDAAEYRLAELARRMLDLEKLRHHHEQHTQSDGDVDIILIKSLHKGGDEIDEIVSLNERTRVAISDSRKKIETLLYELEDNELRLALVAEVTHGFLTNYRQSQLKKPSEPEEKVLDAG